MQNNLPILYTFIRCPWAMRARMALCYMHIAYEPREVDLKHKPAALLTISPKGTVPVLVLPEGKILEQSLDIILWAMPEPNAIDKPEIDKLIAINDNEFKQNLNHYKYPQRFDETDVATTEQYRLDCEQFLRILEENLRDRLYLVNQEISIADLAIFPLVRQFSKVEPEWFAVAPYPNIRKWLADINSKPFFQQAMEKLQVWSM